jgi:hypothetical protein
MPGGAAGGQRVAVEVEGKKQGFVIRPQLEGAAFQPRAEMLYTCDSGKEFSVKSGIVYLCFGELFAEKSQRLPVLAYLLLQDRSNVGVGGVSSQGENGSGEGVSQGHIGDKGCIEGGESCLHIWCPGEGLGVT